MRATVETGFVLILGATLVACGGGSSPSGPSASLSAAGRLAIAQQIVTTALGGVVTGSATKKADSVPLGNLTCQKTYTGASCAITCPSTSDSIARLAAARPTRGRSRARSTRSSRAKSLS